MVDAIWSKRRKDWSPKPGDPREPSDVDYVAGMTDRHLQRVYERLFSPGVGSMFDKA